MKNLSERQGRYLTRIKDKLVTLPLTSNPISYTNDVDLCSCRNADSASVIPTCHNLKLGIFNDILQVHHKRKLLALLMVYRTCRNSSSQCLFLIFTNFPTLCLLPSLE